MIVTAVQFFGAKILRLALLAQDDNIFGQSHKRSLFAVMDHCGKCKIRDSSAADSATRKEERKNEKEYFELFDYIVASICE